MSKGRADESRAARIILKEFVNGGLLYCKPPPGLAPEEVVEFERSTLQGKFEVAGEVDSVVVDAGDAQKAEAEALGLDDMPGLAIKDTPGFDQKFFVNKGVKVVIGVENVPGGVDSVPGRYLYDNYVSCHNIHNIHNIITSDT